MQDFLEPLTKLFYGLVAFALLLGILGYLIGANCGCRTIAVSRALYGGGPPFHVVHSDRDNDLWCDRYHHLLPGVTIDEALDRAREIEDCERAHGPIRE